MDTFVNWKRQKCELLIVIYVITINNCYPPAVIILHKSIALLSPSSNRLLIKKKESILDKFQN